MSLNPRSTVAESSFYPPRKDHHSHAAPSTRFSIPVSGAFHLNVIRLAGMPQCRLGLGCRACYIRSRAARRVKPSSSSFRSGMSAISCCRSCSDILRIPVDPCVRGTPVDPPWIPVDPTWIPAFAEPLWIPVFAPPLWIPARDLMAQHARAVVTCRHVTTRVVTCRHVSSEASRAF
jgi:hypothetical protein